MDFQLSDEQKMLKESARDFLRTECPSNFVRAMEKDPQGITPELWRKMAELGWMGIVFPEAYGGIGGEFLDLIFLLEEMGRVCLPGPFFSTVVLGGMAILDGGREDQKEKYLPKIAEGQMFVTLAHAEPGMRQYDPYLISLSARPQANGYRMEGTKLFVPDAHLANYLLTVARTEGKETDRKGITLFLVDGQSPGITRIPLANVARDKQFEVRFENVSVTEGNILGEPHGGAPVLERTLQRAALAKCAEMVGGAQFVLDMCVAYAKEREQFGRKIGTFQAIQHHCANMLIHLEGSRYITYKAAWMLGKGLLPSRWVAIAKAWVSESYKRIAALGHQIMAGTGYMEEHDMPLYSRRAKAAEFAFGDPQYHRKRMAEEMGLIATGL